MAYKNSNAVQIQGISVSETPPSNDQFLKFDSATGEATWETGGAGGGDLISTNNLSDVSNRQTALNNLTDAASAADGYVLSKDNATGNAVWEAPTGGSGSSGVAGAIQLSDGSGSFSNDLNFSYETGTDTLSVSNVDLAGDLSLGTVTGTKIGTATNQKLGFWNATPVVQDSGWTMTNKTETKTMDCNDTTINELADVVATLVDVMKNYGLLN